MLAVKVPRMRNNNLDIRIAGTSSRAQQPDFSDFRFYKSIINRVCMFFARFTVP